MKKVLFILLLLVVALAVAPLFLPKTLYVEDEYIYDEEIGTVFEQFYNLKNFTQFNEWTQEDPDVKLTYSSPSTGPHAYYSWSSELKEIGDGKMQIVDAKLEEFILYELVFGELEDNTAEVIFQNIDNEKTRVIWSFESAEATYPFQVYNWLMQGSVKKQLHQSLANLDSLLHKENKDKSPYTIKQKSERKFFGILQSTAVDSEEIETAMAETFGKVRSYLRDNQNLEEEEIGEPVVLWKLYSIDSNATMFYAGYFIDKEVKEVEDMEYVTLDSTRVVSSIHKGDYSNLPNRYTTMRNFAEENNLNLSTEWYNVYLNTPNDVDVSSKLKTEINIPIIE